MKSNVTGGISDNLKKIKVEGKYEKTIILCKGHYTSQKQTDWDQLETKKGTS